MPKCTLPNNLQIYSFYSKNDTPWYGLANYSNDAVKIWDPLLKKNILWPSTEHFFQAQKINDALQRQRFITDMATKSPNDCRTNVNKYQPHDPNWHKNLKKQEVMLTALHAKYDQCPHIKKLLDSTGNHPIVEDTAGANYADNDWGCGWIGDGDNWLGVLWMQVRAEKRDGKTSQDARKEALKYQEQSKQALVALGPRKGKLLQNIPQVQNTSQAQAQNAPQAQVQNASRLKVFGGPLNNQQASFKPAPTSAMERVIKATGAQSVSVIDDIKIPGKKVVKLSFKNVNDANRFSKSCGNASINQNMVFLGEARATMTFNKLNIGVHGKSHPRPTLEALKWEMKNQKTLSRNRLK